PVIHFSAATRATPGRIIEVVSPDATGAPATAIGAAGVVDEVHATVSVQLDGNADNLVLAGAANISGFGNGLSNHMTGNAGNNHVAGGDGGDTIDAGEGDDVLLGETGEDFIYAGNGADQVFGGQGDDQLFGGYGADVIGGGSGADIVFGNHNSDNINGGADADTIYGGQNDGVPRLDAYGFLRMQDGVETIDGGAGNDSMFGNYGDETMLGGAGDDTMYGGQNNDTLVGGDGADRLYGNRDDDILIGGAGGDTFAFGAAGQGSDVVMDFDFTAGDRLSLVGTWQVSTAASGNALIIHSGGTFEMVGYQASEVVDGWFV
ncbi:MAG: hypothetical protein HOL85_09275, partial [Rhodospirillaceae bacterium]|nr:hypothetical protein [Rhodospirillaceae bacterium]